MKLVIHDLTAEEWENVKQDYEGDQIISDSGTIRPCVGCFGCWNKTPGQCVLRDGYENMGVLIHQADEIVVISRYTYGGFSGFVKKMFSTGVSGMYSRNLRSSTGKRIIRNATRKTSRSHSSSMVMI